MQYMLPVRVRARLFTDYLLFGIMGESWGYLTHGHTVRDVGGSNPSRGTIVGGVFRDAMQCFYS